MPAQTKPAAAASTDKLVSFLNNTKRRFHDTHTTASSWLSSRSLDVDQLRSSSQQMLAAASLASSVALHAPVPGQVAQVVSEQHRDAAPSEEVEQLVAQEREAILEKLQGIVTRPPGHLDREEELYLEQQLSDILGFTVTAELEGNRLNHSIGVMGGEQHLRRFPTDSLDQHDAYQEAGIAPNRGAFGWFTESGVLTERAVEREKYYFAVQTMYLPDWSQNHSELKPWYAYRKMIMINPIEGKAVVGVVGDAGPAQWVHKQFGGSPEVIREGAVWSKQARGRVVLLFVDDPNDAISLGPIELTQSHE